MNTLLKIAALIGLLLTIVPGFLVHFLDVSIADNKQMMLLGTIIWFVSAPILLKSKPEANTNS